MSTWDEKLSFVDLNSHQTIFLIEYELEGSEDRSYFS